jgi:hypothetical protein
MLHLIRSLETNFRNFVRNLRQAPRYGPRLRFKMSMVDKGARTGDGPTAMVSGFTCNLSETGLALAVPTIQNGDHHFAARNRRLMIVLELPTGPIRVQATPVRYQRLSRNGPGYLIGARIVSMNDTDKLRFLRYVHRLSRGAQITSKRNGTYS